MTSMPRATFRTVLVAALLLIIGIVVGTGPHDWSHYAHTLKDDPGALYQQAQLVLGGGPQRGAGAVDGRQQELLVRLDEDMPYTRFDGGISGYSVFSNLYLYGGVLVPVVGNATAADALPAASAVMSGPKPAQGGGAPAAGPDRWAVPIHSPTLALTHLGKRAVRLPGVTYIFNDPPGKEGFMPFFDHFTPELFVPAAHVVASAASELKEYDDPRDLLPSRIMLPRCPPGDSWRDERGGNVWLLQHAVPGAAVEDLTQWTDRASSDVPYLFDKVVIVDRAAAHRGGGQTAQWGKMNMNVPALDAPTHFWDPYRENVLASISEDPMPHVGKYALPVVVYAERREKPTLSKASHEALVTALRGLTAKAEVHVAYFGGLTRQQRIALLSRASVLVGFSGSELMEAEWIPAGRGAAVIELFEKDGFVRDWQAFADMLNLDHVAVQHDRVLSEEDWRAFGRKRGPQFDAGEVDVDGGVVARAVEEVLDKIAAQT